VKLRPPLAAIVEDLAANREVSIDALGEAIGTRAITPPEIDAMIEALESRGVRVIAPEGGGGERRLAKVIAAAREFGRPATVAEIATASGLTPDEVKTALALVKVMQR
jgi:hypothetical protein